MAALPNGKAISRNFLLGSPSARSGASWPGFFVGRSITDWNEIPISLQIRISTYAEIDIFGEILSLTFSPEMVFSTNAETTPFNENV
ncbi:hypothetical protein [Herbaspirillum camelliae]|uniref:hypothetical protein n=1 Tax=Herbaspirillum camelliae TaxID=1892903 RepID=UPI00117A9201|nr:hypothetical protein [Herbaspirillum camelliae]